ncbi:hypothetical protein HH212_19800 [Massilia forsythiae]|uniref:Uncharacterized protein n=1 Tax=Massilia forsythiae TaxID=2728020 RepID=A0A7Z2VZA4_9BURK|nr:hypothetical protein [Massilia forsythiae]QJE01984.1 hypothetical protein HH212_19800 [Massilia forsythiae]
MQVERICFEEVFDAPSRRGSFSFRSGGKSSYGVQLPGRPVPRAGAVFGVAFGRPGDWSTVLGTRDLATQRVTLAMPAWDIVMHQFDLLWLLAVPLLAGSLLFGGALAALAMLAALAAGVAAFSRRGMRQNRRVRAALLAMAPA